MQKKIYDISIPPNPFEKISYHDFTSNEEKHAFDIWYVVNKYNSELKGFKTLDFDRKILQTLNFEILSKSTMTGKRHLISISLKYLSINLSKLHLMMIGIPIEFIDKSSSDEKNYLTVWV